MRTLKRIMLAAALPVAVAAAPAAAQIAGTYEATVPTEIRNENGVEVASGSVVVTLTIEQRADSVFATWQRGAIPNRPDVAPRKLAGVVKNGELVMSGAPQEAKMVRNGEEETIRLFSTYALKLEGDKLEGTQTITNEADGVAVSTRPFVATRKKA